MLKHAGEQWGTPECPWQLPSCMAGWWDGISSGLTFSRAPFLELGCFSGRMNSLLSSPGWEGTVCCQITLTAETAEIVSQQETVSQQRQFPSTHRLNS